MPSFLVSGAKLGVMTLGRRLGHADAIVH